MKKNDDEGFTLIELLIVIVILGILATVVVFAVGGITNRGETNACMTEKRTVETALESYYAEEGAYPTGMSQITGGVYLRSEPTYWTLGSTAGQVAASGTLPAGCS